MDQAVSQVADNWVRVMATVRGPSLLRWRREPSGDQVTVEEPKHLRDAISESVCNAQKYYEGCSHGRLSRAKGMTSIYGGSLFGEPDRSTIERDMGMMRRNTNGGAVHSLVCRLSARNGCRLILFNPCFRAPPYLFLGDFLIFFLRMAAIRFARAAPAAGGQGAPRR